MYVDGFNLYYRQLKTRSRFKWLNVKLLAEQVLGPNNTIIRLNYYTARISGRADPSAPGRQQVYFDAFGTVPEISIHYGSFLASQKWAGLVHPPEFRPLHNIPSPWPDVVKVHKTEEKGSDVNLASHLVRDGCTGAFDAAAIISNDTDLVEPIRIVTQELGLPVGLLSPVNNPSSRLQSVATFTKRIGNRHLRASQFPDPVPRNPAPPLHKPATWV